MATYFYAGSTNCFYIPSEGAILPSDAVEITEERYQTLLEGTALGKVITADAQGYPTLPETVPATAEQNKVKAMAILASTDWTTAADVANVTNDPYLSNQAEFIAYRNEIRKIAVRPEAGDLVWVDAPVEVWFPQVEVPAPALV